MNIKLKKILSPLSYGIILVAAQPAPNVGDITSGSFFPQGRFHTAGDLVSGISTYLFTFVSALAVFAIIYSGIMFMTAGGDTAKAETAKKNLTWAITGLVIALLCLFIVDQVTTKIF